MSVFTTFFHKVEAVAKKLFGSTTWEKTAQSVITYAAPLIETLITLTAGEPAEAIAARVVTIVQADLATVLALSEGAKVAPGSSEITAVTTALNSVKTNLASLLAAAEVKNSTKQIEITAAVNGLIGEVDALLSNLPTTAPGPTPVPVSAV